MVLTCVSIIQPVKWLVIPTCVRPMWCGPSACGRSSICAKRSIRPCIFRWMNWKTARACLMLFALDWSTRGQLPLTVQVQHRRMTSFVIRLVKQNWIQCWTLLLFAIVKISIPERRKKHAMWSPLRQVMLFSIKSRKTGFLTSNVRSAMFESSV